MQLAGPSYPILDQTNEGTNTARTLLSMIWINSTPATNILPPWIDQLNAALVELN